ncbi:MAG: hypothetical protein AAGD43_02850 [Pseudomonadota bacterium]
MPDNREVPTEKQPRSAVQEADQVIEDRLRAELDGVAEEPIPLRLIRATQGTTRPQDRSMFIAIAASIALALVIGGLGGWLGRGIAPANAPLMELRARTALAMQLFGKDVDQSVDIASSDTVKVREWYRTTVGIAVSPPDLSAFGYVLAGARTMMGHQSPAALIAYRGTEGRHLVLFLRHDMDGAGRDQVSVSSEGPHTVAVWSGGQHGVGVAGATAASDIRQIVTLIREQLDNQV